MCSQAQTLERQRLELRHNQEQRALPRAKILRQPCARKLQIEQTLNKLQLLEYYGTRHNFLLVNWRSLENR